MQIFLFLSIIIAVVAVIFALQNTAVTAINFLLWSTQGSLALILLIAVALGALFSFFASIPTIFKGNLAIRSLRKRVSELEVTLADQKSKLEASQKQIDDYRAANPDAFPPSTPGEAKSTGKSLWGG